MYMKNTKKQDTPWEVEGPLAEVVLCCCVPYKNFFISWGETTSLPCEEVGWTGEGTLGSCKACFEEAAALGLRRFHAGHCLIQAQRGSCLRLCTCTLLANILVLLLWKHVIQKSCLLSLVAEIHKEVQAVTLKFIWFTFLLGWKWKHVATTSLIRKHIIKT